MGRCQGTRSSQARLPQTKRAAGFRPGTRGGAAGAAGPRNDRSASAEREAAAVTAAAMELLLQRARSRARALRAVSDLASTAYLDCTWRRRSQAWPSGEEEEQQEEEQEESDLQQQEPPLAVAVESLGQLKNLSQP